MVGALGVQLAFSALPSPLPYQTTHRPPMPTSTLPPSSPLPAPPPSPSPICAPHSVRSLPLGAHPALRPRPPPLPWLAWVASPHYHRTFDRALPPHIPAFPLLRPLATLTCCRDRQPVAVKDSENEWGALGACELLPAARDCLRREIACGERLPAAAASLPVRKSLSRLLSCPFA